MLVRKATPWENQIWIPELWLSGETVFIIGGGPSVNECDLSLIKDKNVLAVNSSYRAVLDAGVVDPILYFTDNTWWVSHPKLLLEWLPRRIVCMSRTAKREAPLQVNKIEHASPAPGFPPYLSPCVKWGKSSGHTAVSLAVAMGATTIVLLGYDMCLVDGKSHFHTDYAVASSPGVFQGWINCFAGWDEAAKSIGVRILNASTGSDLTEFEMVDYYEFLGIDRSLDVGNTASGSAIVPPTHNRGVEKQKRGRDKKSSDRIGEGGTRKDNEGTGSERVRVSRVDSLR